MSDTRKDEKGTIAESYVKVGKAKDIRFQRKKIRRRQGASRGRHDSRRNKGK